MKSDTRMLLLCSVCCCVLLFGAMRWSQQRSASEQALPIAMPPVRKGPIVKTPPPPKFITSDLFYSADSKKILSKVLLSTGQDVDNGKSRAGFHLWSAGTGKFIKSWPLNRVIKPSERKEHRKDTYKRYGFFMFDTNQLGFFTSKVPYEEVRGDTIFSSKSSKVEIQNRKDIKDWLSFTGLSNDYTYIQLQGSIDDFPIRSSDYHDRKSKRFITNTIGKNSSNWPLQVGGNHGIYDYSDSIVYLSKNDKFAYFAGLDTSSGQVKLFFAQRGVWRRNEISLPMGANRMTWNDSLGLGEGRLRFSPDGRLIAFTVAQLGGKSKPQDIRATPRFIYVFDINNHRYLRKITCLTSYTTPEFAFSMDSRRMVTIESQQPDYGSPIFTRSESRMIDLKSGRTVRTIPAKKYGFDAFTRVTFAPSGLEFALAGYGSKNSVSVFRYP